MQANRVSHNLLALAVRSSFLSNFNFRRNFSIAILTLTAIVGEIHLDGFHISLATHLFAQEASAGDLSKSDIKAFIERMVLEQSKDTSYYPHSVDETVASRMTQKKTKYEMIVSAIPSGIGAKGKPESSRYQRELLKFMDDYREFGAIYAEHIPDKDNLSIHIEGLNRLASAVKITQGCDFANIALIKGLSSNDFMSKVVLPNERLSKGDKFGQNGSTLVFISADDSLSLLEGFELNLSYACFNSPKQSLDAYHFTYDEGFMKHYDNVLLVQPKGTSADQVLDRFFMALSGCLEEGAKLDIAFMGHGTNRKGVTLSRRLGLPLEKSLMDTSDFLPEEKGGNAYATSIRDLFESAIRAGYQPRMIGLGCSSDFLQTCVNSKFPQEERNSIKVFGTPYQTNGYFSLGFNNDCLEMIFDVSCIKDLCGLTVELTDMKFNTEGAREVTSFLIDAPKGANMEIFDDYFTNNMSSGCLIKPSGVIMKYIILNYTAAEDIE